MADDKLKMSAILIQSASAISIAYLTSLSGMIVTWPSYTIGNFTSNNTVLSSPMRSWEVSLLGSLINIGALIVTPICGYTLNKLGRKYSSILFGFPFVLSWSIISTTTSVPLVLAAIGFAGFGAAGQAISPVYISEICHESNRGALTSIATFGYYFGILFSYILGGYLTYYQIIYINLSLSILNIVLLMLLKESPVFLMQIGKQQEAAKSIAFYRRVDVTSKQVEIELAKIKLQLDPRINQILEASNGELSGIELIIEQLPPAEAKADSVWTFLAKSRSSRLTLFAVIVVMSLTILMGSIVIQVYAEFLFQEAVPTLSANTCSIILGIVYVTATLICTLTLDKFGRKFLLTTTAAISGIFCLLLGTQLQLHWAPHWFTAFCIYGYSFVYNLGAAVVPFVLPAEVFLPEIRGFGNSVSMATMWTMNFVILLIFNPLKDTIGLGPLFYGFSVICFIAATYSQYCLPETKGLSVEAIQLAFLGKQAKTASKS